LLQLQLSVSGWGVRLHIHGPPELLQLDDPHGLPPGPAAPAADDVEHNLRWDEQRQLWRGESSGESYLGLEQAVTLEVACHSPVGLFVHAGVVGWADRAWLLPGTSHSGKSELVHALVSLGCGYLSDEFAVLQSDGRVLAYPRPLSLRQPPRRLSPPPYPGGPLAVGGMLCLRYSGQRNWREAERAQAFEGLVANTVAARTRSRELLKLAARLLPQMPVLYGERHEDLESGPELLAWMSRNLSPCTD